MDILGRHEKPLNAPVTMNLQFASLISEYLKMQMWKWGARLRVSHPHEAPCGVRWRSRNDGDIHDCLPYVCGQFRRNVNSRVLKQMIERYNLHRKVDFGRDSVHGGHFSRTRAVEIFRPLSYAWRASARYPSKDQRHQDRYDKRGKHPIEPHSKTGECAHFLADLKRSRRSDSVRSNSEREPSYVRVAYPQKIED